MPGIEPEDIHVTVEGANVVIHGEQRGVHQDNLDLLMTEWEIGPYHRDLTLPEPVDGRTANATYGNGVLVLILPKATAGATERSEILLEAIEPTVGMRIGHSGKHGTDVGRSAAPSARPSLSLRSPCHGAACPRAHSPEPEDVQKAQQAGDHRDDSVHRGEQPGREDRRGEHEERRPESEHERLDHAEHRGAVEVAAQVEAGDEPADPRAEGPADEVKDRREHAGERHRRREHRRLDETHGLSPLQTQVS